jgi:hypothetical protein
MLQPVKQPQKFATLRKRGTNSSTFVEDVSQPKSVTRRHIMGAAFTQLVIFGKSLYIKLLLPGRARKASTTDLFICKRTYAKGCNSMASWTAASEEYDLIHGSCQHLYDCEHPRERPAIVCKAVV